MAQEIFRVLGIAGSPQENPYNHGLILAAVEVAPPGVRVEPFDLEPLPAYVQNGAASAEPPQVREFKKAIREADALLIATPDEHGNAYCPLRNAIDWLSRPAYETPLRHKPVALMGACAGARFGAARAQSSLRQVFLIMECYALVKPEVYLSRADRLFDAGARLRDESARQAVRSLLVALVAYSRQLAVEAPQL